MTARALPGTPAEVTGQVVRGFTEAAGDYDAAGTEFFGPMAEWLVARAGISAGAKVLDLGCGKGAVTLAAARAAGPGGSVTGIDLAGPMLKHARAAARQARQRNVAFQPGDAEDPRPFRPGTFDAIVAGYVIQFLPRPAHAARTWHRLLKPGGVLALTWGAAQDPRWAPIMAAVDAHVADGMPGFEAFFRRPPFHDIAAVNQMLADSGYADVTTVTRHGGTGSRTTQRRCGMTSQWPLHSFLEFGALPGAVPCARLHARQLLWEWGLAALTDSTELVVSELVTNAVQASRATGLAATVRLWLLSDKSQVLVLVWDTSPHPPVQADINDETEDGRGLLLVEAVSQEWAWCFPAAEEGGKYVWAQIINSGGR